MKYHEIQMKGKLIIEIVNEFPGASSSDRGRMVFHRPTKAVYYNTGTGWDRLLTRDNKLSDLHDDIASARDNINVYSREEVDDIVQETKEYLEVEIDDTETNLEDYILSVENTLQDNIDTVQSNLDDVESDLQSNIDTVQSNLDDVESDLDSVESDLQGDIADVENALSSHKSSDDHDDRYLNESENLGDLDNVSDARNNLGLGSVSTYDVGTGDNQVPRNSDIGDTFPDNTIRRSHLDDSDNWKIWVRDKYVQGIQKKTTGIYRILYYKSENRLYPGDNTSGSNVGDVTSSNYTRDYLDQEIVQDWNIKTMPGTWKYLGGTPIRMKKSYDEMYYNCPGGLFLRIS